MALLPPPAPKVLYNITLGDNAFPTLSGGIKRRINWGWATLPQGIQTLPREITFNAAVRALQQYYHLRDMIMANQIPLTEIYLQF